METGKQMQVYYCKAYGPPEVLEQRTINRPAPTANQLLIKVKAVPVTVGDCRIRGFRVPPSFALVAKIALGFKGPRKPILGRYFAGIVEATGKKVTGFKVGDQVFGSTGSSFGTYAEYICLSENAPIITMPKNLSYEQAASTLWGNGTALNFLQKTDTGKHQHILINGASGSVGLGALQLSKHFGFMVTAVCSTKNMELIKSLGADQIIDYTQENFTENQSCYDIVFDAVGNQPPQNLIQVLKPDGLLLHVVASPDVKKVIKRHLRGTQKRFVGGTFKWDPQMMAFLKEHLENNHIMPIIDSLYTFDHMIAAHHRVDTGRKVGDVIVTLEKNNP